MAVLYCIATGNSQQCSVCLTRWGTNRLQTLKLTIIIALMMRKMSSFYSTKRFINIFREARCWSVF